MQYEEILKLVQAVSEAKLSKFEYTEGNIHIVMSCEKPSKKPPMGPPPMGGPMGPPPMEGPMGPPPMGGPMGPPPMGGPGNPPMPPAGQGPMNPPMPPAGRGPEQAKPVPMAPVPGVPAGQAQPVAAAEEKAGHLVTSPLVGTFYVAPSEDAPAFVKVGDTVKKGQTVAIVEAMKLMNEIETEYDGVVTEVLVKNEEMVEYGQPLFRIE